MANTDLFTSAVNTATGVGRAALNTFYGTPSARQRNAIEAATAKAKAKAAAAAAKRASATPTNPLTGTSAFRTMGQATKPTFRGFFNTVGTGALDAMNLVGSGAKIAEGNYDLTPGQVVGDAGSIARLARLNPNLAARGGAPLKGLGDFRTTIIAQGLQETLPRLADEFDPVKNAANFQQNKANALVSKPGNRYEKRLGLGYNPSQAWKNSVAAGAPVSPNYFGAAPPSAPPRQPMQGMRLLGGGATYRPAVYGQLGEIFDFAKQRGIGAAEKYMDHIIRRDGLQPQQAQQLYDEFYGKLYNQKSFAK